MIGFAVRDDGVYGCRSVDGEKDILPNEFFSPVFIVAPVDTNSAVKSQIDALESQQTPRRIREAAIGIDGGWLKNLDAQIAALRKQLK